MARHSKRNAVLAGVAAVVAGIGITGAAAAQTDPGDSRPLVEAAHCAQLQRLRCVRKLTGTCRKRPGNGRSVQCRVFGPCSRSTPGATIGS